MRSGTNRRRFVAACLAASLMPLRAARDRVIGFLTEGAGVPRRLVSRLAELGYAEGAGIRFEVRRVPVGASVAVVEMAARAVTESGAEIVLAQGAVHLVALRGATTRIALVSMGVSNPVGLGLAQSLARPGLNVTGLSFGLEEAARLQVGTLKALRPRLARILFVTADHDQAPGIAPEHAAATAAAGVEAVLARVSTLAEVERAMMGDSSSTAAWIAPMSASITSASIAALALRQRLATHSMTTEGVRQGLLCSCWIDHSDAIGRVAATIDKILGGARPADIPFEQPDKPTLALNRATAAAIGATVDGALLLRATEVVG
jgi:putative ABC transport system substrate-binding protein